MSNRTFILLILIILLGGSVGAYVIITTVGVNATNAHVEQNTLDASAARASSTSAVARLLIIPAINVTAHVQTVGITKSGSMAVPTNYVDVGWYKFGVKPGTKGSAVLDGHVDDSLGLPAVFKNLAALKLGDVVYISDEEGRVYTFRVTSTQIYDVNSAPTQKIFSTNDGKSHLNLITCDGTWIRSIKSYDKRLVVFTELVS